MIATSFKEIESWLCSDSYMHFFMLVSFYFIGYAISNFGSSIVIVYKVFCVFVYVIKYGVIEKCLIGNAKKFWNIMGELL